MPVGGVNLWLLHGVHEVGLAPFGIIVCDGAPPGV